MSAPSNAPAPFRDLVEECFDEAAFLWRRGEAELTSLTRNLDEVWTWTEERLHGALDGVRVGGRAAIDIATEGLLSNDIDRITAGAGVLASNVDPNAIEAITAALAVAEGDKLRAIVRGLELLGSDQALRAAASVLSGGEPAQAGALCRVKSFRRVGPRDEAATALKSDLPDAQIHAVRASAYAPSPHAETLIGAALRSRDANVRAAATEVGLCRGVEGAWDAATRSMNRLDAGDAPYLNLLALFGKAEHHESVFNALRVPQLQQAAMWAMGHIGTIRAVEACVAGMQDEKLARVSGEAYCWITGADLDRDGLAAREAPAEVPSFEEDDLDANLVPPPEALWPKPDVEAVQRDWRTRRSAFAPDVRHIHGRPASGAAILDMIERGPMLRRPDLILELRVKTRGKYDVEPRAFASRQRQMMAQARAAVSGPGGR